MERDVGDVEHTSSTVEQGTENLGRWCRWARGKTPSPAAKELTFYSSE